MKENSKGIKRKGPLLVRKKYVPYHLINLANKYSRGASRTYQKLLGVGVIEWRLLSVIAIEGDITANEICSEIALDKGAASRSIKTLEANGCITIREDRMDSRKRLISITPAGKKLHDKLLRIALAREKRFMANFDSSEKDLLLEFLRRLEKNFAAVDEYNYSSLVERD